MNIITDKIVFGGNCLTKINGKNVFIPFAIPGEKLNIEITESKKDYDIAKIIDIIEPSPHRITPPCKYYYKCGGCNLMHIDFDYQIKLRKQILFDLFTRNNIELSDVDCIKCVTSNPLNYRARFQLHNGGLKEKNSTENIYIENCLIADENINNYINSTKEKIPGRVHVFGSKKATPNFTLSKKEETQNIAPRHKKIKHTIKKHYKGSVVEQNSCVTVEILNKKIMFDVKGFFQSNLEVLEKTIEILTKNLHGRNVLDMYSGCGTFSVFLCDYFENVTLVEHNKSAIVFAEINLNGKNHTSYAISGAKFVKENATSLIEKNGNFDCVVIDPPRSGIEKEVLEFLCANKTKDLRILSCDPATNARDIKILLESGYKLKEVYLLDFYPQTSHIESLVFLEG